MLDKSPPRHLDLRQLATSSRQPQNRTNSPLVKTTRHKLKTYILYVFNQQILLLLTNLWKSEKVKH